MYVGILLLGLILFVVQTGSKSKKLFGLRKKKSANKTSSSASGGGDLSAGPGSSSGVARSNTFAGGSSDVGGGGGGGSPGLPADGDSVSNSSTLVGIGSASAHGGSNPALEEHLQQQLMQQQSVVSAGGRPVSLPTDSGKRGKHFTALNVTARLRCL